MVIEHLVWDEWNVAHTARHGVTREEVEQVFQGFCAIRESYGGRFLVLGMTGAGRVLAVVIHPKSEGRFYVVTARSADRQERAIYREELTKGGEQAA